MLPDRTFHGPDLMARCAGAAFHIIELIILDSGEVKSHAIYPAWLRNRASWPTVPPERWLEGAGQFPPAIAAVQGMEAQSGCKLEISVKLRKLRKETRRAHVRVGGATPIVQNGQVTISR